MVLLEMRGAICPLAVVISSLLREHNEFPIYASWQSLMRDIERKRDASVYALCDEQLAFYLDVIGILRDVPSRVTIFFL
jgi:hypothetical protein